MLTALSFTSTRVTVGTPWVIRVLSTVDSSGAPGGDAPTLTVTDSAGVDHPLTVEAYQGFTGVYAAIYTPDVAGRHLAVAGEGPWALYFVAEATEITVEADMPTVASCIAYMGEVSWSDPQIQEALEQERSAQFARCRIPAAYPADLRGALHRRVQRALSLRGLPLAVKESVDGESSMVLPGNDPEVRRLEGPYRKVTVG